MPNPRGRPKRHTMEIHARLPVLLVAEIKTQHPELLKPDGSGDFAHGALGKWLESVLWKELRGKAKFQGKVREKEGDSENG